MPTPDDDHLSLYYPGPPSDRAERAEEIRNLARNLGEIAADVEQQADRYARSAERVEQDWHGPRATTWLLGARFTAGRLRRYAQAVEDCAHELRNYAHLLDGPVFTPPVYGRADSSQGIAPGGCYPDGTGSIESETMRIAERISWLAYDIMAWGPICIPPVMWPQRSIPFQPAPESAEVRPAEDMTCRTSAAHRIVGFVPSADG
ncbi:MAG: hypothetical protein GEU93_07455 [Propionibacteriales bacterium]|nr:hypothetical protein [Propionibacteriales bacterium]